MRPLPNQHGEHSSVAPPGLILLSHHAHPALPGWATLCRAYGASLSFPKGTLDEPKWVSFQINMGAFSVAPPGLILLSHPLSHPTQPFRAGLRYAAPPALPCLFPGHLGRNQKWVPFQINMVNIPLSPLRGSSFFLTTLTQPFRAGLRYAAPTALPCLSPGCLEGNQKWVP